MKGIQYTISELVVIIFVSMLPMFWIVTAIQRTYPNDNNVTAWGIMAGLLCAGTIMFGCFLGLNWANRRNIQARWQRIGLMLLGGTLIPDAFGALGCAVAPKDMEVVVIFGSFLTLLHLCWTQERKARRAEGWKTVQPMPIVLKGGKYPKEMIILPPAYEVPPEEEEPQSPDSAAKRDPL